MWDQGLSSGLGQANRITHTINVFIRIRKAPFYSAVHLTHAFVKNRRIIDTPKDVRYSIYCFISKPERVKVDWGRKLRPKFALLSLEKNYGRHEWDVWAKRKSRLACGETSGIHLAGVHCAAWEIRGPIKKFSSKIEGLRHTLSGLINRGGYFLPSLLINKKQRRKYKVR